MNKLNEMYIKAVLKDVLELPMEIFETMKVKVDNENGIITVDVSKQNVVDYFAGKEDILHKLSEHPNIDMKITINAL